MLDDWEPLLSWPSKAHCAKHTQFVLVQRINLEPTERMCVYNLFKLVMVRIEMKKKRK